MPNTTPSQPDPAPEYLSPGTVAGKLDLHINTVLRLLASGSLPGVKVGGQWRIRRDLLDEALTPGRRAS